MNVSGVCVLIGLFTAFETLLSQAFGKKNLKVSLGLVGVCSYSISMPSKNSFLMKRPLTQGTSPLIEDASKKLLLHLGSLPQD